MSRVNVMKLAVGDNSKGCPVSGDEPRDRSAYDGGILHVDGFKEDSARSQYLLQMLLNHAFKPIEPVECRAIRVYTNG